MRVLLTGCTSQHVSKSMNDKIPTFAGLLKKSLSGASIEVVWAEPSMAMDEEYVSSFDWVIVGMASPGSLAANYIYPALSVAQHAHTVGNLIMMVDAPEPHRLWAGLLSVVGNPKTLTKGLYSRRKDYDKASSPEVSKRLHSLTEALAIEEWPITIAPILPWSSEDFLTRHIPPLSRENSIGLNLDAMIHINDLPDVEEGNYWCSDSPTTQWSSRLIKTLSLPAIPLKGSRVDDLSIVVDRVRRGVGTLISTHRGGEPWWTPSVSISLKSHTPVISDWRVTEHLGVCWSMLPANIEEMSLPARRDLAIQQAASYKSKIPDGMHALDGLLPTMKTKA